MIWFDLDNSPHVPLFRPILADLRSREVDLLVTSRRHAQTEELLALWDVPHTTVGTHGGRGKVRKVLNLVQRARALRGVVRGKEISLGVSHGSRTHMLAAASLGIRYLVMDDYEYSEQMLANRVADHILLPEYIPEARLRQAGFAMRKVIRYRGFKEEVYLKDFRPEPGFRASLGVPEEALLVTLRPPSVSANYHDQRSESLFRRSVEHFASQRGARCIVVNRTEAERRLVPDRLLAQGSVEFLQRAVDGLQLLWCSDAVVSGGGTMNREAALLGVPTYSVFTGRRPAMDEHLAATGRLTFLETERDVEATPLTRRERPGAYEPGNPGLARQIADLVLDLSRRRK